MKYNVKLRKAISILIMMGLAIGLLLIFVQADTSVNVGVDGLGVSYTYQASGNAPTVSSSKAGELAVTVKSDNGFNGYASSSLTLTLRNNFTSEARLSFNWSVSKTKGSWSINGNNAVSGTFNQLLPSKSTITITVTSNESYSGWNKGVVMDITSIKLEENVIDVTTTFLPPKEGGSYSVDGVAITSETTHTKKSNYRYQLSATPASGYAFAGWKNEVTGEYLPSEANCSQGFPADTQIRPVFVSAESVQFKVGNRIFFDLNVANTYATSQNDSKLIILLKGGALPKDTYIISSGVTLLIPYSDSNTEPNTTEPSTVRADNPSNQSAFRTLIIPSGATVNVYGSICVNSQVTDNKSIPTGQYGLIKLKPEATINLNSGANLYCWGYISGDGEVIANKGATVYECFQLRGWRGGNASYGMLNNDNKVFLLNQFYIQNIEAALTFEYGATENVFASVIIREKQGKTTKTFIANDSGMFRPQNGCKFTKKYIPATDRVELTVDGDMTIGNIELNLSITLYGLPIKVNVKSQDYVLPIPNNYSVDIRSGTTTIASNQNIALLPGAKFTVSEGAIFRAASNMYVYDRDQWIGDGTNNFAFGANFLPVYYSTINGTTKMRTDKDLVDATIDVNGKMEISGQFFTTTTDDYTGGGANIFSTQGTGEICFVSTTTDRTSTYQATQKDNTITGYPEIKCNSAWLRNGDGTYTETAGAQAGWSYKYDTVQQRWYRFRVDYQFNGKNIGYDLITTDTATRDVSDYITEGNSLTAKVVKPTPSNIKGEFNGNILTVSGIDTNCTINIEGVAASYTPYFVLNEHQYSVYLSYGGTEITNKVTIDNKTYYVVESCGTMEFGAALSAPSDEKMGVSKASHNSITWFLEDVTTGAQQFMGTVPSGTTKGWPVYIYGIYNGAVAHNSYTNEYYTNLKDAIVDLPVTGSATLTMYANCGTFEDESKTASYSLSANITFNVNGKEVWGSLVNNGTLTLDLNGGSVRYITGATAGSTSYRASAAVINNGTMTIQDSKGGGVISTDAISDNGSLQNYAVAVRNQGNGTLSMNGVTVATTQTVNDASSAVLNYNGGVITSMNNCSVVCKRGYGITNYGGTIQTISGGTINGGDAATAGRYGIQNRNIRSGSQTDAAPFVISKLGTIDTISDVTVYVYQYGIINYATVNRITGNTNITTTADSAIRNQAGWYYDTQVTKGTTTEANNVKTTVYTYDTVNFPTIKEISGNVTVTANGSYAIWNSGNIEKISGDMNGAGVLITRPNGNYTLENSGYIGEIGGKVTIYSSGEYVLMQNIWGSSNARQIGQTYIQKDVDKDGVYTGVGDVREYDYEYIAPVIDKIGGANSEITVSGTKNVLYNFGTINAITDGVTVTARTEDTRTDSNALLNGHSGGGYKTNRSVRTNMGKDALTNRFETRLEEERTYYQAKIGSIVGDVTIECKTSSALRNGGIIDSIGSGVTIKAANNALKNTGYTFSQFQNVSLRYYASEAFRTDNSEASGNYAYTATTPVITLIDGPTIQATSGSYAIENGGTIGTIQNANISAKSYRAIHNASNVITDRKIYKDNTHTTTYALTELFDAFFTENANTGKYTAVAGDATPNRVDSYGAIPTITLIGAGNTISAAKQPIYNQGEITRIDSGSDAKTSIITATDQAGEGQAIFNFSALAGTKTFTDGRSGVYGDYKTPAHIGTIRNVNVTAAYRAIQNGDAGNYLNVIDEIGANTDARATGNVKGGAAVYNASINAQIKSITNGTYTAATAGNYAVYNASMTYAITIEGGYFKGGLADTANRAHAIYEPDKTERQTYSEGRTLSNKPNKDGYYYITNKFTIKFAPNDTTDEQVEDSTVVPDWTVDLSATGDINVPTAKFTRKGYIFQGWGVKNADGTEKIIIDEKATTVPLDTLKGAWNPTPAAGDEVTLYAIWKPNKVYSVTVSWSKGLEYTYIPNEYTWNATEMRYEHTREAGWIGANDSNPTVTISNGGDKTDVTYGHINAGIQYTPNAAAYNGFTMDFLVDNQSVGKGSATLATKLAPKNSVTTTMKLEGTPFIGMDTGKPITIGTVALTLTTAD